MTSSAEPPPRTGVPSSSEGDREVIARLVSENIGWLRGWIRGRVGDEDLVHDVCQDSFLKAFRALPRLRDLSTFPAWLYRIAENTLRDHLRSEARRRRSIVFTDSLDERQSSSSAEADVRNREESERLLDAVRALPHRYREPLLLRHSRGLPYAEIGAILGISEKNVQVRIFRARKMLQKKTHIGRTKT